MFTDDYVMKMVEALGRFVAAMAGLKTEEHLAEADATLEDASRTLTGLGLRTLRTLPVNDILEDTLGNDRGPLRAAMVAALFAEIAEVDAIREADLMSRRAWAKSLWLLHEAVGLDPSLAADQADLVERIGRALPEPNAETGRRLLQLYMTVGRFDRAEDVLHDLHDRGWPGAAAVGDLFYDALEALDDEALEAGGLPRDELADGRAALSGGDQTHADL